MSVEFRILNVNLVNTPSVVITKSSEDPAFPVTNLQQFSRSRTWRTTGNFVIDSTNNKLDFDEGGSQITATITSGTYTPTTLATEIKTRLDASVGAGTYTVTYSVSTGKWTISETGAATFNIRWNTGTNTAVSIGPTIGFTTAANSTGALTYTGSLVAIHTEEWVVFDFGSAVVVDSVAILFDPVEGATVDLSGALTIQANASNVWTAPSVSVALTIDSDDVVSTNFFTSDQTFRYWRLKIVDPNNPNLYVEIPKLILANATVLDDNPEIGFSYVRNDQSVLSKTDYGHLYADELPKLRKMTFSYKAFLYSDVETLINIFNTVGTTRPFAISLDSTEAIFDKDRFFVYGHFTKDLSMKHVVNNIFDHDFEFEEVI